PGPRRRGAAARTGGERAPPRLSAGRLCLRRFGREDRRPDDQRGQHPVERGDVLVAQVEVVVVERRRDEHADATGEAAAPWRRSEPTAVTTTTASTTR